MKAKPKRASLQREGVAMGVPAGLVWPEADAVDVAVEAYVRWREESAGARDGYRRWSSARRADRLVASCAYIAALDREEAAAAVLADAVRKLGDLS
jgi:hypothetical protein